MTCVRWKLGAFPVSLSFQSLKFVWLMAINGFNKASFLTVMISPVILIWGFGPSHVSCHWKMPHKAVCLHDRKRPSKLTRDTFCSALSSGVRRAYDILFRALRLLYVLATFFFLYFICFWVLTVLATCLYTTTIQLLLKTRGFSRY